MNETDKCQVKFCRNSGDVIFYGFGVCWDCYKKYCEGKIDLKAIFKIVEVKATTKEEKQTETFIKSVAFPKV
jgi:hypothetical protein